MKKVRFEVQHLGRKWSCWEKCATEQYGIQSWRQYSDNNCDDKFRLVRIETKETVVKERR